MNEIEENEVQNESDRNTENRVILAWKCIMEQYFERAKTTAMEEGPGMSIFKFLRLPKNDGSNCQYLYTEKDGPMWKSIIDFSSDGEKLHEIYDPAIMVAICVHVPLGTHGDRTIGNFKLFHRDSEKEITLISSLDVTPSDNNKERDDNHHRSPENNCGLRKRKVSSTD